MGKEETKREISKYFELNGNENIWKNAAKGRNLEH